MDSAEHSTPGTPGTPGTPLPGPSSPDSTLTTEEIIPKSSPESYDDVVNRMKRECVGDERKFIDNIVDLRDVPDDYSHVYLAPAVIAALETNIHLSQVRWGEFGYGVLQRNRLTGAVVFGPPGTGKTLVSQAVARKCRLNMLSISSGDIFHENWGADEKAIRAAFGLARRLHPCIMFVDEADGILGKRREGDKKFVRSMLSEFLREWDGALDGRDRNPFVLLATNMPWDLDPAVLRRAPVRILIDVPSLEDRKGILGILLRDEKLGEASMVDRVAGLTRSFSGSDLKNLCVAAALRCVQEQQPDGNGKYPERRELCMRHFELALRYVKPSASDKFMSRRLRDFQRNIV
ncbi:hypothetical protein MAPG_11282 [Magnaporthiopsis poae ATCC 64411]|uniref:AAA+ ATPase domain-containing protein n=1 Tax=Magnaporthiopsis poae (strain ATCC 64411 / 73-15) TaxID=644358 RepID=A0A0C4EEV1_MAGP6|nr:hypothetical protein MAPG_11282 [Magnaporthiopsis poae ATCC 64411]